MAHNPTYNIIGRPRNDLHHHLSAVASRAPIIAENIHKSFGNIQALDGVSLYVEPGTIVAILGPNGAGKTTLLRILTTLLQPDSGRAAVAGFDVVHQADDLRSMIGLAGQSAALDETLTGRENLVLVGRLYHMLKRDAQTRAAQLLDQFRLADAADRSVKTYSGGMRRRLDLAASLVARPQVLFLDEPTTGLDPRSRNDMWNVINSLVQDGTTILLTTQYLEEADHLADRIVVIDHGRVIAEGTADELKSQVGRDMLELHVTDRTIAEPVAHAIADLGVGAPQVDRETGTILLPVSGGTAVLADVIRRLDHAHVQIADILLRRPTLDDVFLALTGHATDRPFQPPQP